MNFGTISSIWFGVAAGFLIWTGAGEWRSAQSKGASSWENETSFAALQLRAQGKLKIGLGLGFFAMALGGKNWEPYSGPKPSSPPSDMDTHKQPSRKPSKVVYGGSSASTIPVKPPTFKKD